LPLDDDGLLAGDDMEGGDDAVGKILRASTSYAIAGGFIGVDLDDGVSVPWKSKQMKRREERSGCM